MIIEPGECNLKDWIKEVGMSGRMQSELVASFRGADSDDSPEVKRVVRWIRKQCIKLNNPRSHFMRDTEFIDIKALMDQDAWQWDRLKTHFYDHLKQSLAIIAFFHPDEWAQAKALKAYHDLTEHESILPEDRVDIIQRLKDDSPIARGEWVIQDWVLQLTGKMQSALFCAMRGSDIATEDEVRRITHWLRWVVMKNVKEDTHYMKDREFMNLETRFEMYPSEWGNLPIHFRHHTREALEIVGYMHPDEDIRDRALAAYEAICKKSKGKPETRSTLVDRMKDEPGRTADTNQQRTNLPQ